MRSYHGLRKRSRRPKAAKDVDAKRMSVITSTVGARKEAANAGVIAVVKVAAIITSSKR